MAYNENINLFVTTDRNNADVFNAPLEKIIENIEDTRAYLNQLQVELDQLELRLQSEYTNTEQLNDILANGIKGDKGDPGEGLAYNWNGTALGVKLESEDNFIYTDLKGEPGDVSTEQLEEALTGYPTLEYLEETITELEEGLESYVLKTELEEDLESYALKTELEEDLESYALKTEIPTTLPASDVYDWAKASSKPSYTASEVGALSSSNVNNSVKLGKYVYFYDYDDNGSDSTRKNTYLRDGIWQTQFDNIQLNSGGIVLRNMDVVNNLTSNSTTVPLSANQGRVLNNSISSLTTEVNNLQEQLENIVKKAGDYMGKTMVNVSTNIAKSSSGYTYTNTKGGLADFTFTCQYLHEMNYFKLIIDGTTIITGGVPENILKKIADYTYELKIPFTSTFTIVNYHNASSSYSANLRGFIYVNK